MYGCYFLFTRGVSERGELVLSGLALLGLGVGVLLFPPLGIAILGVYVGTVVGSGLSLVGLKSADDSTRRKKPAVVANVESTDGKFISQNSSRTTSDRVVISETTEHEIQRRLIAEKRSSVQSTPGGRNGQEQGVENGKTTLGRMEGK